MAPSILFLMTVLLLHDLKFFHLQILIHNLRLKIMVIL
jgi:hypothetical protein